MVFDEVGRGAEVDFMAFAFEEGVTVAVLIALGGEAEEPVVVDGAGEVFDWENGDETENGVFGHLRLALSENDD